MALVQLCATKKGEDGGRWPLGKGLLTGAMSKDTMTVEGDFQVFSVE
jgi:hypothetical protein